MPKWDQGSKEGGREQRLFGIPAVHMACPPWQVLWESVSLERGETKGNLYGIHGGKPAGLLVTQIYCVSLITTCSESLGSWYPNNAFILSNT